MRQFLAIELPESVRRAAAAAGEVLAGSDRGWRFALASGLHVTIRFLGDVDPSRCSSLDRAWRDAAHGVGRITLRMRGGAVLPAAGRPRVLALGVDDLTPDALLSRLAARVEAAARVQGFPPESRPFAPHVTLARARRGARVVRPPDALIGDCGTFVAQRMVLFRSEPERGGSRYLEEGSYPLVAEPVS